MRFPLAKKVNLPGTSDVIVIVTGMPFFGAAAKEGVPITATSATFVIVMKKL